MNKGEVKTLNKSCLYLMIQPSMKISQEIYTEKLQKTERWQKKYNFSVDSRNDNEENLVIREKRVMKNAKEEKKPKSRNLHYRRNPEN